MESVSAGQTNFSPTRQNAGNNFSNASTAANNLQHNLDMEKIARGVTMILEGIGEDVLREGLRETPERVARLYKEMVYGTGLAPASEITCKFSERTEELILVRDVQFFSLCEHHLVPFFGVAHIGYIPQDGVITGLSKLARVVELAARRLQVQERMTEQIADALVQGLNPIGVIVVVEAEHLCMSMRGIKKPGSKTITQAVRGMVANDRVIRSEAMALVNRG